MYGNSPMAGGPNDIRPPVPGAGAAQVQGDNIDAAFAQHAGAQQVIFFVIDTKGAASRKDKTRQ